MASKIAFIGLGNMGGAMVRNLIASGHSLAVYARRAETMQPFVELGARACASSAEAARDADFICTNVTATADVGPTPILPSRTIAVPAHRLTDEHA